MISFTCPSCSQPYHVPDDKAGKRAKCKKCGEMVTVPAPEPAAPDPAEPMLRPVEPASLAGLVAFARANPFPAIFFGGFFGLVLCLALFQFAVRLLTYPDKAEVEGHLASRMPVGSKDFHLDSYDRTRGEVKFRVAIQDYGDPLGALFEVSRHPRSYDDTDTVYITVNRWNLQSFKQNRLVEYVFKDGKLNKREVIGASSQDGAWLERTAALLDQAVRAAY